MYNARYAAKIAVLLALLSQAMPAHAGQFYLDIGAGVAQYVPTVSDGTWKQDAFDRQPFDTQSLAWRVGLGYAINERWSIQSHYLNWGSIKAESRFVYDHDYDPKAHACISTTGACENPMRFKAVDTMQGADLSVTRSFPMGHWSPFVKVGGAVLFHKLTAEASHDEGQRFKGMIPMGLVGGGLCYKAFCAESTFYTGFGGQNCLTPCGNPISTQALVTLFTVKIPLRSDKGFARQ